MVVAGQDKKDSMMNEKHLLNPMGYEHYRLGDLFSHEEDKHFSLENGKE
jgi:hypothetical protein